MLHPLPLVAAALLAVGVSAQAIRNDDVPLLQGRSAVFDSARGTVLLLGDSVLHELRGGSWHRLPVPSPEDLSASQLFANPARQGLLALTHQGLFSPSKVWACDMLEWTLLANTGPAQLDPRACYDSSRNELVAFGRYDATLGNRAETWVFDGSSWVQRFPSTVPPSHHAGAMAYDELRQRVVMLQGNIGSPSSTWEWDGLDWQLIATNNNPTSRSQPGLVFDNQRGRMVLVGGMAFSPSAECWEYDGTDWQLRAPLPGAPRGQAACVFDPSQGKTLVIGGSDGSFGLQDAWAFDGTSWAAAPDLGRGPTALVGAAMAIEPGGTSVLLYGGSNGLRWPTYRNETWRWDGSSWTELAVPGPIAVPSQPAPLGSGFADAMMWSQQGQVHLLFGSTVAQMGYAVPVIGWPHTMSTWTGSAWLPQQISLLPPTRSSGAIAVDTQANEAVLFGGLPANPSIPGALLDDTWIWNGVVWQQLAPANQPSARFGHSLAYDPIRDRIVLFGGVDATGVALTDTWEWDGNTWLSTANTPQVPAGSLAFDPSLQLVVLFPYSFAPAGSPPASGTALWIYTGSTWVPVPTDASRAHPGGALGIFQGELLLAARSRLQRFHVLDARLSALGVACSPAAPVLAASRLPELGAADFQLELTYGAPFDLMLLAGSTPQAPIPVLGCVLHVDPSQVLLALLANARGRADQPLPIPVTTTLLGNELHFQGAVLAPQSPAGLTLTRGLRVRLGR